MTNKQIVLSRYPDAYVEECLAGFIIWQHGFTKYDSKGKLVRPKSLAYSIVGENSAWEFVAELIKIDVSKVLEQ